MEIQKKYSMEKMQERIQPPLMTLLRKRGCLGHPLVLVICLLAIGGCLSGPGPTDHFYQLQVSEPERRFDSSPLAGTLQVARPWASALTGERPLLYRDNRQSHQTKRHAYHRWVDSPTVLLQQEMTHYLRSAHLADQVVTPKLRVKVDYILSCEIVKMERILESSPLVILELELGITSTQESQVLFIQTYRQEQVAGGDEIDAAVVAYNQALSTIFKRFLEDVERLPKSPKPNFPRENM